MAKKETLQNELFQDDSVAASGTVADKTDARRTRIPQTDVPGLSLDQALRVPRAIFEQYAGREVTPLELATALDMTPTSGQFRTLTGAAVAYGLTEGAYNAPKIKPLPLASQIFRPLAEGQDVTARRKAVLMPRVVGQFLKMYDGSALPRKDIALNVLESVGVPHDRRRGRLESHHRRS